MTASATERPAPIPHTFTLTVEIDPQWIAYITQYGDIFGRPYYAGYWACGVEHDPELGWLVAECDESESFPPDGSEAHVRALELWRAGEPLPERWYRLDRAVAIRMWEEGVKHFGVGWYESAEHGGPREDLLLQYALLGENRYG